MPEGARVSTFSPTTLTGTIANYDELVDENNELRFNDIFYRWEFGDGHTEFGKLVENGDSVYDPNRVTIDYCRQRFVLRLLWTTNTSMKALMN